MHRSGHARDCDGNRPDAGATIATSLPPPAIAPGAAVTILVQCRCMLLVRVGIALLLLGTLSPEATLPFDAAPLAYRLNPDGEAHFAALSAWGDDHRQRVAEMLLPAVLLFHFCCRRKEKGVFQ
jgi:hypothetical protein